MTNRPNDLTAQSRPLAWTIDAHAYSDAGSVRLIHSRGTDQFLTKENVFGVVAAKGMGKTLLLKRKSEAVRATASGVFLPQMEPCEKLDRLTHDFSRDSVRQYSTVEAWKILWCTAIASAVLYRVGGRIPPGLRSVLGVEAELQKAAHERRPLTIESTLSSLLMSAFGQFKSLYATELKASLSQLADNVFVFLDNVDEALEKHVGDSLRSFERAPGGDWRQGALSAEVWTNAQLGLLAAMRDLHFASRRLHVYAALRQEAVDASTSALTLQEADLIARLECPKPLVEQIFIANIKYLTRSELVRPDADDPYERLLGWREIVQWVGAPSERAFDFIYRHTLGRPRELLEVGKAITELPPAERTQERVIDVVERVATALVVQYKREMIPFWDERYDELLKRVDSNVLPERTVLRIYEEMEHECPQAKDPFSYFINRGLMGRVAQGNQGQGPMISFVDAGSYVGGEVFDVGASRFYFVHPCMEAVVLSCNAKFSRDSRQIVGYGVPFTLEPEGDLLHIAHSSTDRFVVIYHGHSVEALQTEVSAAVPMFVATAVAVARSRSRRVSIEAVLDAANDLVSARVISATRDGIPIDQFLRQRLSSTGGTRKGRNKGGPLRPLHGLGQWCKCKDGVLEFVLCEPDKIDAARLLSTVEKGRRRRASLEARPDPP